MRTFILALVILVSTAVASYAQLSTEEIAIVQNLFGREKRQLLTTAIKMTPSDSIGFWPIYENYEQDRKDLSKKRIMIIQTFVSKYPALSNEELNELMSDAIDLDEDQHDLMASYYGKIKKVASPMVAAQWLQLESYISAAVKLSLQEKLPFLGDIKILPKK